MRRALGLIPVGALLITGAAVLAPTQAVQASTTLGQPGRIVFDSNRDGSERTYSIEPDGTGLRLEAPTSTIHFPDSFSPQYAPDGASLTYVATFDDGTGYYKRGLAVRDFAASSTSIRSPHAGTSEAQCLDTVQPTWSPDGGSIAFVCQSWGLYPNTPRVENNIWVTTNADYTNAQALTFTDTIDEWPSWSPNGHKIVFQSSVAGDHDFKIESINAVDGSGRTVLASVANPGRVFNPEYSPDGSKILYEVTSSADFTTDELWLMNADGSGKTRLTHDSVWEGFPTWSPDGRHLLFSYHSAACGCDTLATMAPSSSDVPHVIGGTWNGGHFNNYAPHWQQLPDTTAPSTPSVTGMHTFTTASSMTAHLASKDSGAGVRGYRVQTRTAAWNSTAWGAWSSWTSLPGSTYTRSSLRAGRTYCVRAVAIDRVGNYSAVSRAVCTARVLDDAAATRSTAWTRVSSSSYYAGSALRTTRKGATLTLRGFTGRRVALLVRTCSTCGTIHVSVGSISFTTRSTHSANSHYRVLLTFPALALTSATVRIVSTSSKPVYIDGIGLSRT